MKKYITIIILAVALLSGCGAAKKTSRLDKSEKETSEQLLEQRDITREIVITDTSKINTGEITRTIIEFLPGSIPATFPSIPLSMEATPGYYEQWLYFLLLSRIKSIEHEVTKSSDEQRGKTSNETTTDNTRTEKTKTEIEKEEQEEKHVDPVEITPGWVKGIRWIGIILLLGLAVYIIVRVKRVKRII